MWVFWGREIENKARLDTKFSSLLLWFIRRKEISESQTRLWIFTLFQFRSKNDMHWAWQGPPLGSSGSQHLWPPLTWRLPHLINCGIKPRWKLSAESDSNSTQTSATNWRANTLWQSSQAISYSRTYLRLHSDQCGDVWWNYFWDLGIILWIKASVLGWHQKSLSGSWCSHAADLKGEICPWHPTLAKAKAILLRAWIK